MLNSLSRLSSSACAEARLKPDATERRAQLINARPIYWLLRCSIRCLNRGSPPVAFARTDNSGRPIPRCHALTLSHFSMTGLCVLARTI